MPIAMLYQPLTSLEMLVKLQATGNGQGGVQASASASVVQSNQASSASPSNSDSSANALPETGMANEGIAFAAAMLALAGFTMIKHEYEE